MNLLQDHIIFCYVEILSLEGFSEPGRVLAKADSSYSVKPFTIVTCHADLIAASRDTEDIRG